MIRITYSKSDREARMIRVDHVDRPTFSGLNDLIDYDKAWVEEVEKRIAKCTSLVIAEYTSNKHWYDHTVSVFIADAAAINDHEIDIMEAAKLAEEDNGTSFIWIDGEALEFKYRD